MFKAWRHGLFVAGLVLLVGMSARIALADDPPGAKLFATYCAACHGEAGKGGFAPAIGKDAYLSSHDDAAITQVTSDGLVSNGMPAWSKAKGGTLSDEQIADIVAFLRSLDAASQTAPAATPVAQAQPAAPAAKTDLILAQSAGQHNEAILMATLKGKDGSPVSGASIAFSRATSFGPLNLGTAKTDAQGVAKLTLADVPVDARQVTAAFKGDKGFEASQAAVVLESPDWQASSSDVDVRSIRLSIDEPLVAPEGSLITPNPPLVPATLFVLVVLCVWSIYGVVVYQLYRIRKAGVEVSRVNRLTFDRK